MPPSQLLEKIIRALPHPGQMRGIDIQESAVEFNWRSQRFRVSQNLHVQTVRDGFLIGDDAAILMAALLQTTL